MGLSINEIFFIFLILLIFVRLEDLPKICFHLGKIFRKIKIIQIRMGDTFSFFENSFKDNKKK